jgi:hypothetical protein
MFVYSSCTRSFTIGAASCEMCCPDASALPDRGAAVAEVVVVEASGPPRPTAFLIPLKMPLMIVVCEREYG